MHLFSEGGGGFMLMHFAETNEDVFIDFREMAPAAATPEIWQLDANGKVIGNQKAEGGKSVGVPGEVAGLEYALEHFGSLDRKTVMQPAIDLAENGYLVSLNMNTNTLDNYDALLKYPEIGKIYLTEDKLPYEIGSTLVNKDLAKSLRMIAEGGKDRFFKKKNLSSLNSAFYRSWKEANCSMRQSASIPGCVKAKYALCGGKK